MNSSEKMLRYNLKTKKMQFLGEFSKTNFKWTGGCVYKNKLFSFPRRAEYMLSFDLKNGDIYALPVHADNILRLNFEEAKAEIPIDLYNAFFNDFY